MRDLEEVELFLKAIKEKLRLHPIGIIFRNRNKNLATLAFLDIIPSYRNDIIKKLKV